MKPFSDVLLPLSLALGIGGCFSVYWPDRAILADLSGHALFRGNGRSLSVDPIGGKSFGRTLCTDCPFFHKAALNPTTDVVAVTTRQGLAALTLSGDVVWTHALPRTQQTMLVWSADGTKLAFASTDPRTARSTVNYFDTTDRSVVPIGEGRDPQWVPGSAKITYSQGGGVVMRDLNTSTSIAFVDGTKASWSPDGRWFSVLSTDGHFWLGEPSGKLLRPIVDGKDIVTSLSWSEDSRYVLFTRRGKRGLDLTLDCPEAKQITAHRLSDGAETSVDQVCKSPHVEFQLIRSGRIAPLAESHKTN